MKVIERKYLLPFVLVTSLFALWGLANNMTDTLLAAFRKIMQMSDTQTSFIQMAFYGAYFCLALPAALFIRKHNYKSGVILGLCMYAAGAILFLPAAWAESYAFYLIAIYIMASGCSVLETTANPYIMAMGSTETATRRLNIAQSFNPIGSIAGILISKFFILQDISLYSVSGTYAFVGGVLLVIMLVMLFARMPEGKDDAGKDTLGATFRRLLHNKLYAWGVVAQFFYIGAQTVCWAYIIYYGMHVFHDMEGMDEQAAHAVTTNCYLFALALFAVGRFVCTYFMKYVKPGHLLFCLATAAIILLLGTIFVGGRVGLGCLVAVSGCMSLMFPTIYGIALNGLKENVKFGGAGLVMSILGGSVIPPIQAAVMDIGGEFAGISMINLSFLIPLFCFIVVAWYGRKAKL